MFKPIQKTFHYSVFTKTIVATFGLAHMKMKHIYSMEQHLNYSENNERKFGKSKN